MNIAELFPLDASITIDMINIGRHTMRSSDLCIGALALKSVLPEEYKDKVKWLFFDGFVGDVYVKTKENINLVDVCHPQKVTFVVRELKDIGNINRSCKSVRKI